MGLVDTVIVFAILATLFIMIYAKMKGLTLKEAWEEAIEWLNPVGKIEHA